MRQCDICKLSINHGLDGKCQGQERDLPCLLFEEDERGRLRFENNGGLDINFGVPFPELDRFTKDYSYNGNPVKIVEINPRSWDMKQGILKCRAKFWFFEKVEEKHPEEIKTKIIEFWKKDTDQHD